MIRSVVAAALVCIACVKASSRPDRAATVGVRPAPQAEQAAAPAATGTMTSPAGSSGASECRHPEEPNCNPCCNVLDGRCSILSWQAAGADVPGVEPWYNASSVRASCPTDCRPCARCLRRHELEAKYLTRPAGCDCTGLTIGVDPCYQPGSCECFCQHYQRIVSACPELESDLADAQ